MTDRAELARLILQLERDLMSQAHLRALLIDANTTVANRRQQLRAVKLRIGRAATRKN